LALRWAARLLGLAVLGAAALFFIGEGAPRPSELTPREAVLMLFFCTALVGLAAAWKWELAGGLVTVGSLACFLAAEWLWSGRFPRAWAFGVIALPAFLFFLSAYWNGTRPPGDGRDPSKRTPTRQAAPAGAARGGRTVRATAEVRHDTATVVGRDGRPAAGGGPAGGVGPGR
jgi:hypothetical protein